MTTLRAAAQQALEALEDLRVWRVKQSMAITALRAALAQQAEPVEPVAWMVYTLDGKSVCVTDNPADFGEGHRALPLYTAPPQRKQAQRDALLEALQEAVDVCIWPNPRLSDAFDKARAAIKAVEEGK